MKNYQLTNTEMKIFSCLSLGLTNKKISHENNISVNTVKFHLKNIYRKLEASTRVEAIIKFNNLYKSAEV